MGFSGGGSNVLKPHTHDGTVSQDGGPLNMDNVTQASLTAGDIVYSDGVHLQRLPVGADTTVLSVSGSTPSWSASTSNPLIKVSKTFADISSLEMDIYTLPQDAALVNVYTDITTVFNVSTAVTIGDAGDDNGFQEATDWTAGTGLTDATRGAYVTSFKTMRSTTGTTAIKAYNFTQSGSTFTQSNTDNAEDLYSTSVRTEVCQLYQAGQVLIGQDVCKASWFIRDTAGTATGDLKAYIRTSAGVQVAVSTTVLDVSTVTAGYLEYTFDFPATTMVADYMICLNSDDMTAGTVNVQSYNTNIANGLMYLQESGVYVLKTNRSVTGTVTYACAIDTQGEVDFYLQVVD
jgi:hypothetical protein